MTITEYYTHTYIYIFTCVYIYIHRNDKMSLYLVIPWELHVPFRNLYSRIFFVYRWRIFFLYQGIGWLQNWSHRFSTSIVRSLIKQLTASDLKKFIDAIKQLASRTSDSRTEANQFPLYHGNWGQGAKKSSMFLSSRVAILKYVRVRKTQTCGVFGIW